MAHGGRHRRKADGTRLSRREGGLPKGPFTGRDVERVLRSVGYEREAEPADDEVPIYVHPGRDRKIPVNPDWQFTVEDSLFDLLRDDLGMSGRKLRRLLSRHDS